MSDAKVKKVGFTCHTPNLLKEIATNVSGVMRVPLNVFRTLLLRVAQRATELNDHELNILMLKLTLYEEADPESDSYIPGLLEDLISQGEDHV